MIGIDNVIYEKKEGMNMLKEIMLSAMIAESFIQPSSTELRTFSNNNSSVSDTLSVDFSGLKDDDKILKIDGGYLYGGCSLYDADNNLIGNYNSQTSLESITVAEARKEISEKKNEISLFGAYPPDPDKSNPLVVLDANSSYTSNEFTGSGWRFSGKRFFPASGTGDFLRWTCYVDGGRVGNYNEAYATKNGNLQGTAINAGQSRYVNKYGSAQIYYTYNPLPKTYYVVENR